MNILAIETSCDETALTILQIDEQSETPVFRVLSHFVLSQIDIHKEYGGVFPNLAKRAHAENLPALLKKSIETSNLAIPGDYSEILENKKAKLAELLEREPDMGGEIVNILKNLEKPELDYICVTNGPGLEPALWVGINFAQALGLIWDIPVVPVNHMEGHIVSVFADGDEFTVVEPSFPTLSLLVSGGHTELVLSRVWGSYEKIGQTVDDAVGEAFDKTARMLGLQYPGGPKISQQAQMYRDSASREEKEEFRQLFPRPMKGSGDYNFSFSGLKTAVLRYVKQTGDTETLSDEDRQRIAYAFEEAVADVLMYKTKKAIEEYGIETLIIAGGVSANRYLRESFAQMLEKNFQHITLKIPDLSLTGDNSLMIAVAGYYKILDKQKSGFPQEEIRARGNLSF
jgi:N6-L-threonylcarbamoyladenine synthase